MAVVLLSGGLDSTTVLYQAARSGPTLALFVDYGQRASETERRVSADMASRVWAEFVHIRVPDIARLARSTLTGTGPVDIPQNTVVPGRNALLLSLGAALANSRGIDEVLIGCNQSDALHYRDCHQDFVKSIGTSLDYAYGVRCRAPLVNLDKVNVVRLAREFGVPVEQTSSCYLGTACGKCAACIVRNKATQD